MTATLSEPRAEQREDMELLTASEVAAMLRVDRGTVYHWAQEGLLPSVRLGRATIRFPRAAVRRLLAENTVAA